MNSEFEQNNWTARDHIYGNYAQWAKSAKNSLKECVFVNAALKIRCYIVKYTLLRTAFSVILPNILLVCFLFIFFSSVQSL